MMRTAHARKNVKNDFSIFQNMVLKKKDDRNRTKNSEIIRFLKIAQLRMKRTAHAHENVKNELSMYENMDLKKKMKKIDRLEAEIQEKLLFVMAN